MTASGVRHMLANRVYLGELHVGVHVNPDAHPPIVTVDEFDAAGLLASTRPARSGGEPALLAGLVRCCACGHVMSRGTTTRTAYICHRHSSDGACPRPAGITARRLDEYVERIALAELSRLSARPVTDGGDLAAARDRLREVEAELAAYLSAVKAAGLGAEDFATGARERREQIEEARAQLAAVSARELPTFTGDPGEIWETLTVGQRNRLLCGLIETVLVEASGRGKLVPVEQRARVVRFGAGIVEPRTARGAVRASHEIVLPDINDPAVLRVDLPE